MGVVVWIVAVVVALLLVFLTLEARREAKKSSRGTASRVMRAGFLEMQTLLEPERKVEILKQGEQQDLLIVVDPSGDPPAGKKE